MSKQRLFTGVDTDHSDEAADQEPWGHGNSDGTLSTADGTSTCSAYTLSVFRTGEKQDHLPHLQGALEPDCLSLSPGSIT